MRDTVKVEIRKFTIHILKLQNNMKCSNVTMATKHQHFSELTLQTSYTKQFIYFKERCLLIIHKN